MGLLKGDKVEIRSKTLGIYSLEHTPFKKGEITYVHSIGNLGEILLVKNGRLFEFNEIDLRKVKDEKV